MTNEKLLTEGLTLLGIDYDTAKIQLFERFTGLMLEYNEKVNLTSVMQETDIIIKHYLDSASLLTLKDVFHKNARVVDIGCGAGLPSFPLKFLRNDLDITLIDSLRKRVDFQKYIKQQFSLDQIECFHGRAEELSKEQAFRETFDVALIRAVAKMNIICEYCLPYVKPGGYFIAMKGPDVEEELKDSEAAITKLGGKLESVHNIQLPFSDITHSLIVIKKISATLSKYPRITAKIKKSPL